MRTIAIVFGDNDFGGTFSTLLAATYKIIQDHGTDHFTEQSVRDLINWGVEFYYRAYNLGRGWDQTEESIQQTLKYLKGEGLKVLFDEEAEADIINVDHDSGAWYVVLCEGIVRAY